MRYVIHLGVYFEIFAVVALSLNLVVGYCGLLSLSHAAFYALGAYSFALMTTVHNWSFATALIAAMGVAAISSLALSLQAMRLRGDYFVLGALAVEVVVFSAISNWYDGVSPPGTVANVTNGPFGIIGIPRPRPFIDLPLGVDSFWLLCTMLTTLAAVVMWRLTAGDYGRLLIAVRDNELAARALGKNTRLIRMQVMAISAAFVGMAGSLYAAYVGFVDPTIASLDESILMLSMVLIGGSGNFRGPLVGAAVLLVLPELLKFLYVSDAQASNIRLALYGAALIVIVQFRPQGIAGDYRVR